MPTHHPEDYEAITGIKPTDTDDEVIPLYVLPDAKTTTVAALAGSTGAEATIKVITALPQQIPQPETRADVKSPPTVETG